MAKIFVVAICFVALMQSGTFAQDQTKSKDQQNKKKKDVTLKVGDTAPNWKLTGSDGKEYQLSDYKGKKAVVVAWYPMALTGG